MTSRRYLDQRLKLHHLRAVEAIWVGEDYPDAARVGAIVDQMIGRSSAPRQ